MEKSQKVIDLNLKAKFLALYWGQEAIIKFPHEDEHKFKINSSNFDYVEYLELTPLEQISDEDLLKCYHLHSGAIGYDYTMDFAPTDEMINHWMSYNGEEDIKKCSLTVDYLRLKGYALPFNGITVEQQIKRGWVKLKNDPNI